MDIIGQLVYEYADCDTQRNLLEAYNIPIGTYRSIASVERWTKAQCHLEKELPNIINRLHVHSDCTEVVLTNRYRIYHVPCILSIGIICRSGDGEVDWMIQKQRLPKFHSAWDLLHHFIYDRQNMISVEECCTILQNKFWDERYVPLWKDKLQSEVYSISDSLKNMQRSDDEGTLWEWQKSVRYIYNKKLPYLEKLLRILP